LDFHNRLYLTVLQPSFSSNLKKHCHNVFDYNITIRTFEPWATLVHLEQRKWPCSVHNCRIVFSLHFSNNNAQIKLSCTFLTTVVSGKYEMSTGHVLCAYFKPISSAQNGIFEVKIRIRDC